MPSLCLTALPLLLVQAYLDTTPGPGCNVTVTLSGHTSLRGTVYASFTPTCTGAYSLMTAHAQLVYSAADPATALSDTVERRFFNLTVAGLPASGGISSSGISAELSTLQVAAGQAVNVTAVIRDSPGRTMSVVPGELAVEANRLNADGSCCALASNVSVNVPGQQVGSACCCLADHHASAPPAGHRLCIIG